MKFVCERCHTKYSIADEKVRGKVLKVRCKTCTNVITVRETGATTEDAGPAAQREPSVAQSGTFNEGAAPTVANAAAVAKAAARSAKPAALPAEALFSPGAPAAAPPRRPTPPPVPPLDDVEWYLAVDGAQTGPFSRARLVDKILAQPKDADVHIWNSTFDAWKPPKDVAEVDADVRKRRAAPSVPPPPMRRPSGALPITGGGDLGGAHLGAVGAGMATLDSGGHAAKSSARPKKNGTAPGLAVGAAVASVGGSTDSHAADFGLGDLLGDGGLTPPPSAAAAALANGPGLFDPVTLTPPPSAAAAPAVMAATAAATAASLGAHAVPGATAPPVVSAPIAGASTAKGRPVKLLLGAAAVVAVVCGIVLFWMFRKPTTSVAASPPAAKSTGTDFAGLAEKLAKEEAEKTPPPPPPPVETPPPAVDVKSVTGPPAKGGRGKKTAHRSTAPPPLSPTSPPPPSSGGLTADQRAAASRFGESTGREVRVPTNNSGSAARSTPAQGDISRVINNNRQGIQTCYQRALLRDNSLTHGKVTVRVSIGLSGKVKSVSLDAPAQFRALEPCIRDVMSRWAFPPSSEEYGTEFPVVLQGNN